MAVPATLKLEPRSPQRARLRQILGCTESELETALAGYATAALEEYVRMFIGERVFTRGSDLREYRLFLLVRHVWQRVPEDHEVSALFQTTAQQSKTLLRNVLSKFQYELEDTLEKGLRAAVEEAERRPDDPAYTVVLRSPVLADALDRLIERIDERGELPQLAPSPLSANAYKLQPSTREALLAYYRGRGGQSG